MRRIMIHIFPKNQVGSGASQSIEHYSTKTAYKVGAKYSNNGAEKNHTHVLKETCIIPGCNGKSCIGLCGPREKSEVLGHNTHRPPIGRIAKRISDEDANGIKQSQWSVRNNNRKEILEQERHKARKS